MVAAKTSAAIFLIGVTLFLFGPHLFSLFGFTLDAFRIGAGVLLFLTAVSLMGDNRDNSMDSRFWGLVDRSAIRAKAWRIYWSWGGLGDIRWDRIGKAVQ